MENPTGDLLDELRSVVGNHHVLVEPDVVAGFETDWTGRYRGSCLAVVRPGSVDEVAAALVACGRLGVPVVPQGGNTGLVAGAVPPTGSVVLSLRRLDSLGPVDTTAGQVTAGAGVTLARLQEHARRGGWAFGVDLGARDTATVGGMVATNAGGVHVLRHGAMRSQVLGVEAVLADGRVIRHLGGLVKDNTGYDLPGLVTGSEGTLAVVTASRLRLVPEPPDRVVVLAGLATLDEAVALASDLRVQVDGLLALEAVLEPGLSCVERELGVAVPFTAPIALLVEWGGHGEPPGALVDLVGNRPHAVAADASGRARLWAVRERQAEAIARTGIPHKLDVTLPLDRLAVFAGEVQGLAAERGWTAHLFGHLGDGNLHVNVIGPAPDDVEVDDLVLRLVASHQGSISAEHGIGRAKARWLSLARSPEELAVFGALKAALDPAGLLNPGVLVAPQPPGGSPVWPPAAW